MGLILRSSNVPNASNDIVVKKGPLLPSEEDGNLMYLLSNLSGDYVYIKGTKISIAGNTTLKGNLEVSGIVNSTSSWANVSSTTKHINSFNIVGPNGSDSVLSSSYAIHALKANYADKVDLKTTNGTLIESNIRSINGQTADKDGNIAISLLSTQIGTLDEMNASSSNEGTIWITTDGITYLLKAGKWIKIPSYNQTAADQRYLKLTGGILTGPLDMDSNDIVGVETISAKDIISTDIIIDNTAKAKEFIGDLTGTADKAKLSSNIEGGLSNYISLWKDSTTLTNGNIFQDSKGNIGIETTTPQHKLDVNGGGKFNSVFVGNVEVNSNLDNLNIKGNLSTNTTKINGSLNVIGLVDSKPYPDVLSVSGLGGRVFGIDTEAMSTVLSLKLNNSTSYKPLEITAGASENTINSNISLKIQQNNTLTIQKLSSTNIPLMVVKDNISSKLEVKPSSVTINTILELPPTKVEDLPESPLIGSIVTIGNEDKFGVYVYNGKTWKQLAFA